MIPEFEPPPAAPVDPPVALPTPPGPLEEAPWRRFPLTKTFNPADREALAEELTSIDPVWLDGQAAPEARAWEYAMVLRCLRRWIPDHLAEPVGGADLPTLLDVGGAGSPLCTIVDTAHPNLFALSVIDPSINHSIEFEAEFRRPAASVDVICLISVLEHVKKWKDCLRACATLLRPGGLLVVTTDYWNAQGPDTAHFHWMRERIYNRESMGDVLSALRLMGLERFGVADWTFHGNQVYGEYTFLATALIKRGSHV